jgi:hypothetical protein
MMESAGELHSFLSLFALTLAFVATLLLARGIAAMRPEDTAVAANPPMGVDAVAIRVQAGQKGDTVAGCLAIGCSFVAQLARASVPVTFESFELNTSFAVFGFGMALMAGLIAHEIGIYVRKRHEQETYRVLESRPAYRRNSSGGFE